MANGVTTTSNLLAELDVKKVHTRTLRSKKKINRLHSPIIRQLPPDVMSTVFEFCLPDFTDHQILFFVKDPTLPLSLGAICSYWREIAWPTPSLWSSLVVRVTNNHIVTGIVREWLARSGQLPLSIRIYLKMHACEAVSAVADIINQYSTRWSDLELYMPEPYYQYFHAAGNLTPILKSIRFHDSAHGKMTNFELTSPHLERAYLSYFPVKGINIHWDNLTHLTLHSMSIVDSFLILRKAPRLVFCEATGPFSPRYGGQIQTPVLTSLKSLQLLVTIFAEEFLDNLVAPHLEEFSLPDYYVPSMEVAASFLRRSACSLRSFSVIFSIFRSYSEGVMNILQSMPSLNTLSILSTSFLDAITTHEDCDPRTLLQLVAKVLSSQSTSLHQGLLPNLKILEYTGELHLYPGNYENLYSLPPADNVVHGSFHLLKLNFHRLGTNRLPENMISYLLSLEKRGVTVNVPFGSSDILQSSINYHKRRKESLCRDWIDNFDSSLLY